MLWVNEATNLPHPQSSSVILNHLRDKEHTTFNFSCLRKSVRAFKVARGKSVPIISTEFPI